MYGVFHPGLLEDSVTKGVYLQKCQTGKVTGIVINASIKVKEQKEQKDSLKRTETNCLKKPYFRNLDFFFPFRRYVS